ncbi:hypothetical protein [Alienimonas chondri]|uniref:Uncharacterized protein n=1 Tax=Alienimonas chondri TaxID=2681879 RepID=A0ABX1VID1_9PLAN|nr:hypothetical protein [Alienimonas chondri]NNJ27201.1 hypothetical protein [Alienimonas chondri]
MFFGGAELLFVGFMLLYGLNWIGLVLFTGAMGLRRRRWGTPGGGWMLVSAALYGAVGLGLVMLIPLGVIAGPGNAAWVESVALASVVVLIAVWVGSNAALAKALFTAWRAADEAVKSQGSPGVGA